MTLSQSNIEKVAHPYSSLCYLQPRYRISLAVHHQMSGQRKCYNYTVDFHPSIKSEIVSFAGKWMEQEIMFSKIIQTPKDKCHVYFPKCRLM